MRLDAISVPRIMLQVGFCGVLVAGTYLIAQERPKDSARLLSEAEEAQFTLGTKGDRMIALHQSADEGQKPVEQKPVEIAMAPEAEKPAPAAPTPPAPPKPKRVSATAAPAAVEHREVAPQPVPAQVPASPAWTAQPAQGPAQPAQVAAQPTSPPVYNAPITAQPVVPPPPPPKPKEQETFLGLPPMPTPREFFDNTVKETNAAFGKMKQAMQDAFR